MTKQMFGPVQMQVGDQLDGRTVLEVRPYRGKYPQWFNVVLVITSPHTRSGRIERAYNDLALRPRTEHDDEGAVS